jgi:ribosomal protein L7/L12
MTPLQKAVDTFDVHAFDAHKVLLAMAEKYPQVFLELTENYKQEATVSVVSGTVTLDRAQHETVIKHLQKGNPVLAIKYVREVTGAGLKDAKNYVDKFRSIGVSIPTLDPAQFNHVTWLLEDGKHRIHAIKYVREVKGCGLKEALMCVDNIRDQMYKVQ